MRPAASARIARGLRDRSCSSCAHGVKVGVLVEYGTVPYHFLFCRHCARSIGRAERAMSAAPIRKAAKR